MIKVWHRCLIPESVLFRLDVAHCFVLGYFFRWDSLCRIQEIGFEHCWPSLTVCVYTNGTGCHTEFMHCEVCITCKFEVEGLKFFACVSFCEASVYWARQPGAPIIILFTLILFHSGARHPNSWGIWKAIEYGGRIEPSWNRWMQFIGTDTMS